MAPTLAFFMGLFMMVGGLVHTGVIETLSQAAAEATEGRLLLTLMALFPYVATMSPSSLTSCSRRRAAVPRIRTSCTCGSSPSRRCDPEPPQGSSYGFFDGRVGRDAG